MIKAVLFDCFGTLFYDKCGGDPFRRLQRELNLPEERIRKFAVRVMTGKNLREELEKLLRDTGNEEKLEKCMKIMLKDACESFPYPDALEVIKKLREKYRVGIITNTYPESFEKIRRKYQLDNLFDIVITSYETGLAKPDPRIFLLAVEKLGIEANEAVYVGDNLEMDFEGAKKAGLKAILIDRKKKYTEIKERIENLREILEILG